MQRAGRAGREVSDMPSVLGLLSDILLGQRLLLPPVHRRRLQFTPCIGRARDSTV